MVTLQVNVTSSSAATFTRDYLRLLTWYHNGVQIVPTSGGTISLSSDNTTITIANTSSSRSGVYEVQFAGLRIYPYNYLCERETLAILRQYPLLSPVTFYVYNDSGKCLNDSLIQKCIIPHDLYSIVAGSGGTVFCTSSKGLGIRPSTHLKASLCVLNLILLHQRMHWKAVMRKAP